MDRQKYWIEQGYTQEQIEYHLLSERIKSKQEREKRKKNNQKNQELIKQIKTDLVGKTFKVLDDKIKILSISPTVDGVGFWYKMNKTYVDNSNGDYRYFYDFNGYNKKDFIKHLKYQ